MRIIVDARPMAEPISGGVGRVAFELVDAFAAANPDAEIVCATTGSAPTHLPRRLLGKPNVKHVHLKIPNKLWSLASMLGLVSLYASVQRRCGPADAFFMPNLGFVGRLPDNTISVLLLHDLSFLIEPRWFTLKQRLWHRAVKAKRLIRGATRLLAVSGTTRRDATRLLGIPADRIEAIPLGPTLATDAPGKDGGRSDGDAPGRYILALGSNDPRKNAATAVAAVRELRKENGFEDIGLVLVGNNRNVALDGAQAPDKGLSLPPSDAVAQDDGFSWLRSASHPTDAELAALFAGASAFLYPSWYEGFGLPLHEAAACGTPRVASTSGALPETAPPGTLFANPAKPHHWTQALSLALDQPRTRRAPVRDGWDEAASRLARALG